MQQMKPRFDARGDTTGLNTMFILRGIFKEYEAIFNSDLFASKDWETDLKIEFTVVNKIIQQTYDPYMFDAIPLEILGNIYEQYLGYTIKLAGDSIKYELKPEVRKAGGVYYTPEIVVDYIVRNTVGKLLSELTEVKAKKIRVLDPACGSGTFLIRAYDELMRYYLDLKKQSKVKTAKGQTAIDTGDTGTKLTIEEKVNILKQHIYGVDLDDQSIEVTKLSLMLKMLEGEYGFVKGTHLLPMLDKNIHSGNSLISGSILELNRYFGENFHKVKPFNWEEEYKEIILNDGGFDVVIGNPPYIRSDMLSKQDKLFFSEKYKCVQGQYDIYILFLEKGIDVLKQKGYFGYILPNKFFMSNYGKPIRNKILKEMNIEKILDVSYLPIFKGVGVYPTIMILKKSIEKSKSILVSNKIDSEENLRNDSITFEALGLKSIIESEENYFDFSVLGSARKLADKIETNATLLKNLCEISRGFRPPPKEISSKIDAKKELPKNYHRFLIGKDIVGAYVIKWSGGIVKYDRTIIQESKPIEVFQQDKIFIRDIGLQFNAVLDKNNYLCLKTIYFLYKFLNIQPEYLLAVLNSKLMNYYFEQRFSAMHIGGGYLRFRKQYLDNLPIKIDLKYQKQICDYVEVISNLAQKKYLNSTKIDDSLNKNYNNCQNEIDEIIYKIYGLTEDEVIEIEEYMKSK
jgi:type I restriction-modification system DNA methylase subunit